MQAFSDAMEDSRHEYVVGLSRLVEARWQRRDQREAIGPAESTRDVSGGLHVLVVRSWHGWVRRER